MVDIDVLKPELVKDQVTNGSFCFPCCTEVLEGWAVTVNIRLFVSIFNKFCLFCFGAWELAFCYSMSLNGVKCNTLWILWCLNKCFFFLLWPQSLYRTRLPRGIMVSRVLLKHLVYKNFHSLPIWSRTWLALINNILPIQCQYTKKNHQYLFLKVLVLM